MTEGSTDAKGEQPTQPVHQHDEGDSAQEDLALVEEPPRKRRRTAKPNSEKKFECQHEGCGKKYSRAEHLYRHQLNHTPKQIYRCDFPDCNRYFVRQDLCVRHRERHTTHGSQLHKRDSFAQSSVNTGVVSAAADESTHDSKHHALHSRKSSLKNPSDLHDEIGAMQAAVHRSRLPNSAISPTGNEVNFTTAGQNSFHQLGPPLLQRNSTYSSNPLSPEQHANGPTWPPSAMRRSSFVSADGRPVNVYGNSHMGQIIPQSPARTYSNSSTATNNVHGFKPRSNSFIAVTDRQAFLHNSGFGAANSMANNFVTNDMLPQSSNAAFGLAVSQALAPDHIDQYPYANVNSSMSAIDMHAAYGYPIFGGDDFNRSPLALADDFTAWLFNDGSNGPTGFSPENLVPSYSDNPVTYFQGPTFSQSPTSSLNHSNGPMLANPMNLTNLVERGPLGTIMSENKRQDLLDLMQTVFVERAHDAVKKRKDSVFEGDVNADGHILSLRMMQTYIGSYWYHQHAQLPILHKPTFSADKTPDLLLLAVIAIGAATLDKAYGTSLTDSAAEFANFLAWHIRWEIIRDADFRPPAKLWVFQTLLLIEVYEKMYSTRALHERAHIHHDSTLTLMRRGSSLLGRSASETPSNGLDEVHRMGESHSAEHRSKSEASWSRWIAAEATRRVAFAAFVIDSIHCTMFGHSAKMVAHEMRLPLPCDEGLWSATSPAEVGRVQSALATNGIKPTMFLDGLKKTLNGARVHTNSFGRTIIMAGLLSVSWHMTQRDLQVSSLGTRTASFVVDKGWKGILLRAFDNWKRDFDEALAESASIPASPSRHGMGVSDSHVVRSVDEENIFEARTVLHHLAHIAAHVDIVECQVFAGAGRLLSRTVTQRDYITIREKIEKWATKASARDSAFYALKFIAQVLTPPANLDLDGGSMDSFLLGHASPILPQAFERNQYIARDDFLLNRPWVLYVSALVVWCYGYALEGPIVPTPREEDFLTYEQREEDMKRFLSTVASVEAPDDLVNIAGKNRCYGLLLILKESFASTRWELTHEAAVLLGKAAMKLRGMSSPEEPMNRSKPVQAQRSHRQGNGMTYRTPDTHFSIGVSDIMGEMH